MALKTICGFSSFIIKPYSRLVSVNNYLRVFDRGALVHAPLLYSTTARENLSVNEAFRCGTCGTTFSNQQILNGHIQRKHLDKNFKCSECDAAFSNAGSLKQHLNVHLHKFMCSHCERSFASNGALKIHEVIHSEEKLFQCSNCEKSFKDKGHLDAHTRNVHSSYRALACGQCGLEFLNTSHFASHMLVHDLPREKQLFCPNCPGVFGTPNGLTYHKKTCLRKA